MSKASISMRIAFHGVWVSAIAVHGVPRAEIAVPDTSKHPLSGGTLIDFGPRESIVRYQYILKELRDDFVDEEFSIARIPSHEYWLGLAIDSAELETCSKIFDMKDNGLDIQIELRSASSNVIVGATRLSRWRVSFSPSPRAYDTVPPTRRCTLHPDDNPHFELRRDEKYVLHLSALRPLPRLSPVMYWVLEGKGGSGEL